MTGNAQKIPFASSLSEFTSRRIEQAIQTIGRALPASIVSVQAGRGIVTVKFELTNTGYTLPNVTIPVFGPEWIRYPLTAGVKGVVIPQDVSTGNMSGLGAQTSNLAATANLSSLVFLPIGNSDWSDPEENNRLVLYGPDGSVLRSANKDFFVRVTETEINIQKDDGTVLIKVVNGEIDITAPTVKITGNLQLSGSITGIGGGVYAGNIRTSGDVKAGVGTVDEVGLQTHQHVYTRPNGTQVAANTNAPTAGT